MKTIAVTFTLLTAMSMTLAVDSVASDLLPTDSIGDIRLKEIIKVGNAYNKLSSANLGLVHMSQTEIKNIPVMFGESDIIKALQLQPGVSDGIEGFAGMMVHGGDDDQNLFLIDGNPVYQMNHLGGLFSAYNVESINDLSFYKSSFPARYGGRLSSVVDVSTRTGDYYKYHGTFTLGLTSGNISLSGPIEKGISSFAVSLRRSWLELISIPFVAIYNHINKYRNIVTGYNFTDFNLKLSRRLGKFGTLNLIGYYSHDGLKIGEKVKSKDTTSGTQSYEQTDVNRLSWGNKMMSLEWDVPISSSIRCQLSTGYIHYNSSLKRDVDTKNTDEHDYIHKRSSNGIDDINVNTHFIYTPTSFAIIRIGIGYTHHIFSPDELYLESSKYSNSATSKNSHITSNEASIYVDTDITQLPMLTINAGLRTSMLDVGHQCYNTIEPRMAANFMLSSKMSIKAGYSRMSQFVQKVSDNFISLPTDYWMPVTDKFKPLISDQVSAGIYYSNNDTYMFSIEGWHKKMNNLLEYRDGYNLMPLGTPWFEKLTFGQGRAYGVDFQAEKNYSRLTGFIGYGLLWSKRKFNNLNSGHPFPSKFDNRHKINLSLSYKLSSKIDINASWTYMTGNRITMSIENYEYLSGFPTFMVPGYPNKDESMPYYYEGKNNVRLPAYHRLNLSINIYRSKKNGSMGIWNISIYNAYSRMNPIIIKKKNDISTIDGKPLKPRFVTSSLFPIIPSVSYTYKF